MPVTEQAHTPAERCVMFTDAEIAYLLSVLDEQDWTAEQESAYGKIWTVWQREAAKP